MNTSSFWFQGAGGVDPDDPGFPIHQSLRFNGNEGRLVAPGNSSVSDLVFTYSVWFKEAGVPSGGSKQTLLTRGTTSNPSNPCTIEVDTDLNLTFRRSGNTSTALGNLRDPSAWYHLVVQSFGSGQGYIYINGVGQEMTNVLDTSTSQTLSIGARRSSPQVYFNGYMADIYFVEGTYPATTFGRFNENGVWVPKDPEFGSAAVYSTYLTSVGGLTAYPAINAFNGDITDYASPADSVSPMVWAPPDVSFNSKFEVYIPGFTQATWNGITVGNTGSVGWVEVATGSGTINATNPLTISRVSSYPALYAIKIDGKILIDQNLWSDYLYTYEPTSATEDPTPAMLASTNKDFLPSAPPSNGFDAAGTNSTTLTNQNGDAWLWRPNTPITDVTKIEIANMVSEATWVNGVNSNTVAIGSPNYTTVYDGPPITLTTLSGLYTPGWTPAATSSSGFSALKINGVEYIDGQSPVWGADGFHLTFADWSDVGKDFSGNGNNFTYSGFDTAPVGIFSNMMTTDGTAINNPTNMWTAGDPTGTDTTPNGSGLTIDFENSIYVNSTVWVHVGANDVECRLNGGAWNPIASSTPGTPLAFTGELNQIELRISASKKLQVRKVVIDGTQLTNNTGTDYDLMKDSPTDNYPTYNPLYKSVISGFAYDQTYTHANLTAGTTVSGVHGQAYTTVPVLPKTYFEVTSGSIIAPYPILCFGLQNQTTIDDSVSVKYYQTGQCQLTNNALPAFTAGDVISLSFDQAANTLTSSVNGGPSTTFDLGTTFTLDDDVFFWVDCHTPSTATVNFGQQPFLYPITEGYTALHTSTMPAPTIYDGREEFRAITGPGDGPIAYLEGSYATTVDAPVDTEGMASFTSFPTSINAIYPTKSVLFDFGSVDSCTITFQNSLFYDQTNPYTIVTSADGVNWTQFGASPYENPPGAVSNDPGTYILEIPTQGSNFRYVRVWNPVQTNKNLSVQSTSESLSILGAAQSTFPSGLWWIKDMVNDNQHQLVTNAFTDQNPVWVMPQSNPGWADYVPPTGDSVAWCWSAPDDFSADGSGGAQGDIPCTGKINKKAGFSMIKFTNPTQAAKTIAHGLDKTPEFYVMAKDRGTTASTNASSKYTWHKDLTAGNYIYLDQAGAQTTNNFAGVINAVPTSSVFSIGNAFTANNGEFLALLWTSIPGYSAFGKYTGNNNTDGPFIYTGFSPAFILIKSTSSGAWSIYDSTRTPYNPSNDVLIADSTAGEDSSTTNSIDFLSNGFKLRNANNARNGSFNYIYAAFALNPFQSPVTAR